MYDITFPESVQYHHSMLQDKVRTETFLRAILQCVKPGDVVLDLGCGTAVLAHFACLAGARRVYAVEQGTVLGLARAVTAQNGYHSHIEFIHDWSTNVELPEPVDVIISETIGNVGFEEGILGWIVDARKRLQRPNGRVLPQSVSLQAAPVELPGLYEEVAAWRQPVATLDFSPVHQVATNQLWWADIAPSACLASPQTLLTIDLGEFAGTTGSGMAVFVAERSGSLHGLGGWFQAWLTADIGLSNAPPNQVPSWRQEFFPLAQTVEVDKGDTLAVTVSFSGNGGRWQWQLVHQHAGKQTIYSGDSDRGRFFPAEAENATNKPVCRNLAGDVDAFILAQMSGELTPLAITEQVTTRFPSFFVDDKTAAEHVGDLISHYGRWSN